MPNLSGLSQVDDFLDSIGRAEALALAAAAIFGGLVSVSDWTAPGEQLVVAYLLGSATSTSIVIAAILLIYLWKGGERRE